MLVTVIMSFRYDGDDVKESDDKRRSVSLQDDTSQGRYCPVRPTLGSSYTEQDNDRQKIPLAGRGRACGTQLCTGGCVVGMCCHHQIVSVPHEVCPAIVPVLSAFLSTHIYYIIYYIIS